MRIDSLHGALMPVIKSTSNETHSELVITVNNDTSMSLKHIHFDIVSYHLKLGCEAHLFINWANWEMEGIFP